MSRSSNDSSLGGSWGRRKSLFALSALTPMNDGHDGGGGKSGTLKKHRKKPSLYTDIDHPDISRDDGNSLRSAPPLSESPKPAHLRRPSLSMKNSVKRPPSVLGSLRSTMRNVSSSTDAGEPFEPLSTTSSKTPSLSFGSDASMDALKPRVVLLHGEVQTSAGMFRKKKEYLVLTETAITRYKSQAKASEAFSIIPSPIGRTPTIRHGQMPSAGSSSDLHTIQSDSSGEKDGRVPLRQVVAVHRLDDGKPYFAIEFCYLDEDSSQASGMTLQFSNPEERDVWLRNIRGAVTQVRLRDHTYISPYNLENAARIIERDNDYDPANCAIFKVIQRSSKSSGRSSSDDLSKVASNVCFLAIGVHKLHLIQLVKAVSRSSSPSLAPTNSQASYGILTLTGVKVSHEDDSFDLTFRQPLQRPRHLHLASSASFEIAARLHYTENFLRPEWGQRLFKFEVPLEVEDMLPAPVPSDTEEHCCLDRTLIAYCVAYSVNPTNVRYTINYNCEDAPRFELLAPADTRRTEYGPLDILAIMRALRYNESFGSMSFAGISLDAMNGLHDNYGNEHVCVRTKRGTPIKLTPDELGRSCLLVQEVRALAATSKKLRRMDFSNCVTSKPAVAVQDASEEEPARKDIGCGVVEALFPLCRHQTTNVDWVCLNGIQLTDTDLDYLVGAAVEKSCHFRAIELNRCGLNDRSMGMILDALRAQDNTLEAVEIAGNTARHNPITFDSQLSIFGFIRKLNLSHVSRTSGDEPLITAETLLIWRLSELRLSGTAMNAATVDALATYLAHPQSESLHELYVDNCYLSGSDIATLLHSMMRAHGQARNMHLDISQNNTTKDLERMTQAISMGMAPTHLSMRAMEYKDEAMFRKVLTALTANKSIQYLDISQTALHADASDDTCRALEKLLAENDSILDLNISGEETRLASSRFGPGLNDALAGLKRNETMVTFHVEKQKLGIQGASTLAEVLKDNHTLRELYCDNNEIPLQGLTDLVNMLVDNTTIIHLPTMADGRAAAFQSAERTMKMMSDLDPTMPPRSPPTSRAPSLGSSASTSSTSGMKRGLASVRRTAARTASAYTPSFPALPSYSRSTPSPDSRTSSPLTLTMSMSSTRSRQNTQSPIAAPMSFTVQDVQTTHRLLAEHWDRQCYRLSQYLDRNWCLMNDIPVNMEIEDEKFERPQSVGSIGKVLAQVKYDTTPRAEKDLYFDSPMEPTLEPNQIDRTPPEMSEKHSMSFKQFILDSGPTSPDLEEVTNDMKKQLRLETNFDRVDEPKTPTQGAFSTSDFSKV